MINISTLDKNQQRFLGLHRIHEDTYDVTKWRTYVLILIDWVSSLKTRVKILNVVSLLEMVKWTAIVRTTLPPTIEFLDYNWGMVSKHYLTFVKMQTDIMCNSYAYTML